MSAHNVSLAELLCPQPGHKEDPGRPGHAVPAFDYHEIQARIREAYFAVTSGRANTRALLREIRQQLMNVDRAVLDEALKRMQREDSISLYPLDNKAEISDADRSAAIYFGSEPRHLLWIQL
jgi:hypothetical protein